MSAMHMNIHATAHVSAHQRPAQVERTHRAQPIVRDHRDARQPIVSYPRGRSYQVDRRWDRVRPIIVRPAPVVVTGAFYGSSWTPSPSYTYEPQSLMLMTATSLSSGQLAIDTNGLGNATMLEIDTAGSGSTYVTQVVMYDANGNYQVSQLNEMLSAQNPTIQLALDSGAVITKIVIEGHSEWGGAITIQAR